MKIQKFLRKYSVPAMWASGGFCLVGVVLERLGLPGMIPFLLAALLAGVPIVIRAVQGLRFRTVGIECLVTIAVVGACCIGEYSEAAIVTFLFQLGAWLEQKTLAKTRSAIKALTALAPTTAWRLTEGIPEKIDADEVESGDRLLVKTGGLVAADGTVLSGEGYVNESGITGESVPRHVSPGQRLYAGTVLESGTLEMEALRVGEDTTFSRIIALVEEAQDAKSPAERFIDRFARYYTPAVVVLAVLTLLLTRNADTAITVLVLACPGALVIGAPIANVAGVGRGAQLGVLLKGGDSIHTFARTDTMVFDKTGTLTRGQPRVIHAESFGGDEGEALRLAASVEQGSDHPLAKAVCALARERGIALAPCTEMQTEKGMGVAGTVSGQTLLVGSARLLESRGVSLSGEVRAAVDHWQGRCATVTLLAANGRLLALFAVSDAAKPDAAESLQALKKLGIRTTVMLTGDNPQTARAVAEELGVGEYHAGLLPEDKLQWVRNLQEQGRTVTFVGDGVNDSPALTAADTGIAMGSGTDAAMECSDVVLMRSDLRSLVTALALAKKTVRILRQNIAIAVGTVVLLLVGLLLGYIHMSLGMLIHEGSILAVILNAMRLRWEKGK